MEFVLLALGLLIGVVIGALIFHFKSRVRLAELQGELIRVSGELEQERKLAAEKLQWLDEATEKLKDSFKALSSESLESSNTSFLNLARETLAKQQAEAKGELEKREQAVKNLVDPISKSLTEMHKQIQEVEKDRREAEGGLVEQLKAFGADQEKLRGETRQLVTALRKPATRGQWGEMQLRRVVEMAGMVQHCDFVEQASTDKEEGRLRPDLIVRLPGDKRIVVDAKTPLEAWLDSLDCEDEDERRRHLDRFVRHVKTHIASLSKKAYWTQFDTAPEFVVMFLPSEALYFAALESAPGLIEEGVEQKVLLTAPTALIALLKSAYAGWRQEVLAENAHKISEQGKELYERLSTLAGHFRDLGKRLDGALESYNSAMGSLETRVLVSARRFPELGVSSNKDLPELDSVDRSARRLQSPELSGEDAPQPSSGNRG